LAGDPARADLAYIVISQDIPPRLAGGGYCEPTGRANAPPDNRLREATDRFHTTVLDFLVASAFGH
jgi:hypothetical protein